VTKTLKQEYLDLLAIIIVGWDDIVRFQLQINHHNYSYTITLHYNYVHTLQLLCAFVYGFRLLTRVIITITQLKLQLHN
jgi:hypothetical protein